MTMTIKEKVSEFTRKFANQREEHLDLVVGIVDDLTLHIEELNDTIVEKQKATSNLLSLISDADTLEKVARIIANFEIETMRTNITNNPKNKR